MDKTIELIVEGLLTDGAHHKQFALEAALVSLVGVQAFEKLKKDNGWEDGVPA